ncbi:MAG: transport system ATP-binding/permease protein [Pseudonocardiales bacterium]|nr:transport system ATP-binding/permease protein [Pseudonocardiales bacterium]
MPTLRLTLPDGEHQLPDDRPLYLWTEGDRLRVTADRPPSQRGVGLGYFSPMLGSWWLNLEGDRQEILLLDGQPVSAGRLRLPRAGAELRLATVPTSPATASQAPFDTPQFDRDGTEPQRDDGPRSEAFASLTPPTGAAQQGARASWSIGPVGTSADIKIDDPQIRPNHGRLRRAPDGRWWVTADAGPIYVNGVRTRWAALSEGDAFVIGQTAVTITRQPATTTAPVEVSAGQGLSVDLDRVTLRRGSTTLLDDVSLHVRAGEVVALIGPSGSGKTSLVKLLLGEYQPDSGMVRIGAANGAVRQQVRYVPQSDDLYPSLTVYETLLYAARFRWESNTRSAQLEKQVRDVIDWLGLAERAEAVIGSLSGGERRRVSIGTELVGRPQLLLLDEPTSGLDLGKDRDIMRRLGAISQELHCTIIVVTHTLTHLRDAGASVLVLGKGGRLAYRGNPDQAPEENGHHSWADWLTYLDTVRPRAALRNPDLNGARPVRARPAGGGVLTNRSVLGLITTPERQTRAFLTALHRQFMLLWRRGPRSLAALFGMPLLGVLVAIAASPGGLRSGGNSIQALAILVTIAALTGASLTYHELVSESSILRRDWRVGISVVSLLLAKAATVAAVCAVLASAMTFVFTPRGLPSSADALPAPVALFLTLFSAMIASAGLGMAISSVSGTLERAVTFSTALAVVQVALNGSLFQLTGLWRWAAAVLPSRQGFNAMASYADMNRFRGPGTREALWSVSEARFWHPLLFCLLIFFMSTAAAVAVTTKAWRTGKSVR